MQIDITKFFTEASPRDYSASVAEIGADAGPATWRAACDDAGEYSFLETDEALQAFREWLKPWGGWGDSEIAAFSPVELRALFTQWVAGDMREAGLPGDWEEYEKSATAGNCQSHIWRDDLGRVFFSLEH